MDVDATSYILKYICRKIYLIGVGDFWYQINEKPKWQKVLYSIYSNSLALILYIFIFFECLEVVYHTFPTDQHRDCASFAMAHITVFIKLNIFKRNKHKVRKLIRSIIEVCKGYEEASILKEQNIKIKLALAIQFFVIHFSLSFYFVEALRRVYFEGNIIIF